MNKNERKLLSLVMTFLMIFSSFSGVAKSSKVMAEETTVLSEGFNSGVSTTGWTFVGGSSVGTYTTAGNFGAASPSIKLGGNNTQAVSPVFTPLTGAGKLRFWYKGNGGGTPASMGTSSLLIEANNGANWTTVGSISTILMAATNVEFDLQPNTCQIRFTYTKNLGNFALDDVIVVQEVGGTPTEKPLTALTIKAAEEVEVNKTVKLDLGYVPSDTTEKEVTWESLDQSIATVDQDGTVHGVKAGGPVDIKVTSKANNTISAICKVTVKEPVAIPEMTIADARAKASGEAVAVRGVITHIPGGTGNTIYIQDNTAGVAVTFYGTSFNFANLARGNEVKVTGTLTTFNGLLQVKLSSAIEVVNANGTMPVPKVVTIAQSKSEAFEAQLIKIESATIGTLDSATHFTPLTVGGESVNVYYMPTLTNILPGDKADVVAIVSEYTKTATPGYQLIVRDAADVTKIETPDTEAPVIIHTPVTAGNVGVGLTIDAQVTDNRKIESVTLYYRVKGQTQYKTVAMAKPNAVYTAEIPAADISTAGMQYYIEAFDGVNRTYSPTDTATPYNIAIKDLDVVGPDVTDLTPVAEAQTGSNLKPVISAKFADERSGVDPNSVKVELDGADITSKANVTETGFSYTPETDLALGQHNVRVVVSDKAVPLKNQTDFSWNFWVGEKQFNLYFGQLHSHTNLSDGTGTPDEAFAYARDVAKADYVAITDHSNWFDNDTASENITNYMDSTSTEWKQLRQKADSYTEDGKFVAIGAYEMTWSGSTGGWGHINTFNTEWFASRTNKNMDLKAYYNRLTQDPGSVSQLNHPGKTFGDFADFGFYTQAVDNVVDLIEVGNGEGPVRGSGYFPSYEYYTRALDKGWHLAPTNNQDNHKGKWVNANTARTVILAPTLTRDSLYEAMSELRVYSTEDENLRISYVVNDKPMGSSLNNPDKLNISIKVNDPDLSDVIGKISIISDGGAVVESKIFNTNSASWDLQLDPKFTYYYVRIDQADKDIAVTSPVWVGEVTPVGLSKVEVSQDPQLVNKPVDVTATVYNNGTTALNNVKVDFYQDSIAVENKIGTQTIATVAASGVATSTVNWTPKVTGTLKVYAQMTVDYNGETKVFTNSTTIDVGNPDDLVKVVIDGGHVNQYVSGDYAGKMATLTAMLKDKKFMLVQNNDELTAEDLATARVLILTDPQSKDTSSLKRANYSDTEVEVIKSFIASGGSLIITSRADYDDAITQKVNGVTKIIGQVEAAYQSSAQGNRILEAIGSNLRFNDDEVVDNTSNGGQPYRLYFDDYTSSKYDLTGNIVSGQTYSFYSGCSVLLKQGGDETNIDWLVKGHNTTEILDADTNNDATPVEKGKVNALAAETLPNGARIIVAGSTFFSDFETASVDDAYSNKQVTENIISWVTVPKPAELKTIAEVRVDANKDGIPDNLGKKFAIEGRITAQSEAVQPKNAFFEVVYIQDPTGGITVFGVSKTLLPLGTKVRVEGRVDQYQGDAELQIANEDTDLKITDTSIEIIEPTLMTTGNSMLEENEGLLVKIKGVVKEIKSDSLIIDDGTGSARAYVEGYIGDGTGNDATKGKWDPSIKVGDTVSAVGLASEDPEGHRLRVRNTSEIVLQDTTAPEITILGVADGGIYNASVKPSIAVNEGSYTAELNGKAYDGAIITESGDYTLVISAVDESGNRSEKTIKFTIDLLAPTVTILGIVDGGLYKDNVSIVVTASEEAVLTVKLNDKPYDGKEITQDGKYKLEVTAADKAGNSSTTIVNFTIDKTAPVITVTGVENGSTYSAEVLPVVNVNDNEAVVTVTLNDKAYDNKAIAENGQYKLVVTATDKAGNKAETVINFTVDIPLVTSDPEDVVDAINDAPTGSTIVVQVAEDNKVDSSILAAIAGQDKTVVFEKDGASWSFNGLDMSGDLKDLDLSVRVGTSQTSTSSNKDAIAEKVKGENIIILTFAENGVLPGKAKVTINLGSAWANKEGLVLYYYNPTTKKVEKVEGDLKADTEGNVTVTISHCSDYFVAEKDLVAAGVIPKTGSPIDMNTLAFLGIALICAGIYVLRRRSTVK